MGSQKVAVQAVFLNLRFKGRSPTPPHVVGLASDFAVQFLPVPLAGFMLFLTVTFCPWQVILIDCSVNAYPHFGDTG